MSIERNVPPADATPIAQTLGERSLALYRLPDSGLLDATEQEFREVFAEDIETGLIIPKPAHMTILRDEESAQPGLSHLRTDETEAALREEVTWLDNTLRVTTANIDLIPVHHVTQEPLPHKFAVLFDEADEGRARHDRIDVVRCLRRLAGTKQLSFRPPIESAFVVLGEVMPEAVDSIPESKIEKLAATLPDPFLWLTEAVNTIHFDEAVRIEWY